jgi:RNA polymerase sigma factor (sigma-70 family)
MLDADGPIFEIDLDEDRNMDDADASGSARDRAGSDRPAVPSSADRSADAPRDTLQQYLAWIRHIPLLEREEVDALSAEMDASEMRFREALYRVPGTAMHVVARWRDRKSGGRTTALLAHGYRGDVKHDWAGHIDRHVGAVERRLRKLGASPLEEAGRARALRVPAAEQSRLADHLRDAEILLEELIEIHEELCAVVEARDADPEARRVASALGLGAARGRDALAAASQALEDRSDARSRFATHNLRLVVNVAKRFRGLGLSYMDLIQEGNKGLMRAVEKYDHSKGFTFATYAVWWIDQAIIRGLQNHSRTVRVPSHIYQEQRRVRQVEEELRRTLRRDPTELELARETELDPDELTRVLTSNRPIQSLDEPVGEKGRNTVSDTLVAEPGEEPGSDMDLQHIRGVLLEGLQTLDERERCILQWRFGLDGEPPMTLRAIGQRMGISRERVRQLEVKALESLRGRDDVDALAPHLDMPLAAA